MDPGASKSNGGAKPAVPGSAKDPGMADPGAEPALWHGREPATTTVRRYSADTSPKLAGGGQGTLMGVVFPCMANILGVLLFLRLPWIVGKAGILNGFSLVFICCSCTFLTSLSLSAVATNGMIKGGGAYFLISRSLGPALGAGVGLCFYMANSIGAAMYFMGTVEAWEIAAPESQIIGAGDLNNIRVTSVCILAVALVMVGGGIKYVARLGTVFLFCVMVVIACMYLGCLIGPGDDGSPYDMEVTDAEGNVSTQQFTWSGPSGTYFAENFGPSYDAPQKAFPLDTSEYSFIALMALWFPAVTGIMAGSNRSADLADPAGSIPKGTLFAQMFTSFIYLSFVILYGSIAPRSTLLDDKFFASSSAWPFKEVVLYGVMASTIGAGLTSLTSGTRLLSAIAGDGTLPILKVFAAKPGREPRLALLASGVLCACAIAIGELNAVAPVLTMFFLMCYTCVNMSCTILEAVNDPNWRPRFRFHHWSISLVGAILCVWMMFAISALIAMVAVLFCSVVFAYAAYNSHSVKWGDGFQGVKFQLARNILTSMSLQAHTKNWRPQLLVITGATIREEDSEQREEILEVTDLDLLVLASQLKGGRGFTIIGGVCSSKGVDVFSDGGMFVAQNERQKVLDGQNAMQRLLQKYSIAGFGRVVYTDNYANGLMCLVQTAGLGAFQPNCVLTAWPKEWEHPGSTGHEARSNFVRLVQAAVVFQKVVLLAKGCTWPQLSERLTGTIDIWWIVGDGGILLLLPFLFQKHPVWHRCRTRLFVLADAVCDDPEKVKQECETYARDFRLNVEVHVRVVESSPVENVGDSPKEMQEGARTDEAAAGYGEAVPAERIPIDSVVVDDGNAEPKKEDSADDLPKRNPSTTSVHSGLARWRRQKSVEATITDIPGREASFDSATKVRNFPSNPPGAYGMMTTPSMGADAGVGDAEGTCIKTISAESGGSPWCRNVSPGFFNSTEHRLSSHEPCSMAEMSLAVALRRLIIKESSKADLVVTNLPDIPPGESMYGYFQLVEAMTKDMRCILARGTTTEVITAFT